ncbi:MAG: TMEM165/GDT1 family protein [Candidatus Altiarchaeota archaeon]
MLADFLTPFVVVGLAELGDKTQLALVLLASKTRKRMHMLAGAFLGFLIVDGISVLLGSWIASLLSMHFLKAVSGMVFIFFGLLMLHSSRNQKETRMFSENPFTAALLLISLTEWGDKTQIATGLFATQYNPLLVLAGVLSSLTILSFFAVFLGSGLTEKIDDRKAGMAGGVIFLVMGVATLLL